MEEKISYERAKEILQAQKIAPKNTERVFLHDSLNRVLASDIFAPCDMPKFPLSNMDGYAICACERNSNNLFFIKDENPAGNKKELSLQSGKKEAIKTFTGAKIPKGADMLVPIENVEVKGDKIYVKEYPKIGEFIRQRGANYIKGEKLISKGTLIKAQHIGLLASLNHIFIEVFCKPKVGILVSGNELLEIGEERVCENAIYNANGHLLFAKIMQYGGMPKLYKILKDNKEEVQNALKLALNECDMVITSGGASVGDYDFIAKSLKENPNVVLFRGVKIKPGQHIWYAKLENKEFFALPGFPNSTLVTFELFVKDILAKLCGYDSKNREIEVILEEDLSKKDSRVEFRVANISNKEGIFYADFKEKKDFQSAILNNFCPLNDLNVGLVLLEKEVYKMGERLKAILL